MPPQLILALLFGASPADALDHPNAAFVVRYSERTAESYEFHCSAPVQGSVKCMAVKLEVLSNGKGQCSVRQRSADDFRLTRNGAFWTKRIDGQFCAHMSEFYSFSKDAAGRWELRVRSVETRPPNDELERQCEPPSERVYSWKNIDAWGALGCERIVMTL